MDILTLSKIFLKNPELHSVFDFQALASYAELVMLLKPKLSTLLPSTQSGPPPTLPVNVHTFLKFCFSMSDDMGKLVWEQLGSNVWHNSFRNADEECAAIVKHATLFLQHGTKPLCQVGIFNLEPPTRVCLDPRCSSQLHSSPHTFRNRELVEPLTHAITVFTRNLGAVPAFSTSRYCRKCNTRYYHNYFVHQQATIRTYYTEPPRFIQISQHFYMEADLCEVFLMMMLISWTSATNCARIYNESLTNNRLMALIPVDWQTSTRLDIEDVWNGFFLYSLLYDHFEQKATLELVHNASSQAIRLQPALQARNLRMAGPGQEAWSHACDRCCYIFEKDDELYQIRSTVTDGITMGRPCCASHDCKENLPTVKHVYCRSHHHLSKVCAVVACNEQVDKGFKTCSLLHHRNLETFYQQEGKAMFQLKKRLERLNVSQTHNSLSVGLADHDNISFEGVGGVDEEILVDEHGICDGKPESGNRAVKARFGRRRTHNEQLCVASCGVILGRATFFGSEAPNGVRTFWKALFPTKRSLPFVLWHDNNCRVVAMLRKEGDIYFENCALPVDVFHFKSKHKETDQDCGKNCNPYIWRELRSDDGKSWRFNSSAAEQANVWFGGYRAIVREMQSDRYDFFLDEMIKHRNRLIIKELEQKGHAPYLIPRSELLAQNPL